jgi:hypothetical protein
MKKLSVVLLAVLLSAGGAHAYGPRGHTLVGAVADRRLAKKSPATAARVAQLLDGLTLAGAANLPDNIKDWDGCGGKQPGKGSVNASKRINRELRAFLNANLCSGRPSHHEFHYTDVPVFADEAYGDGTVGRGEFDIVKMIPFCIGVLKGDVPEQNDRKITKSVAVILLTHYLGDIHQPLHVGAQFFDSAGRPFQPTASNHGFEDQGGNKLTLFTFFNGGLTSAGRFHGYWDSQTVENAFGAQSNTSVAARLANRTPEGWQLSGGSETWAEQMANRMLPVAREAHRRLAFTKIVFHPGARDITSGRAEEVKKPGREFYAVWAGAVVRDEIHRAGWRLAALLEDALR